MNNLEMFIESQKEILALEESRLAAQTHHVSVRAAELATKISRHKMLNSLGEFQDVSTLDCRLAAFEARRQLLMDLISATTVVESTPTQEDEVATIIT